MQDPFNWELTKEKVECRYWPGVAELENTSHDLVLEDSHGFDGCGPNRECRETRHKNGMFSTNESEPRVTADICRQMLGLGEQRGNYGI